MKTVIVRHKRTMPQHFSTIVVTLLLLITPVSLWGADNSSIDMLRQMGKAFSTIAGKASPAVVGIKMERTVNREYPSAESPFGNPFDDDFFDFFFHGRQMPRGRGQRSQPRMEAQGSGFIISPDGYILTNNHMVENADKIKVKVGDSSEVEAKIIGRDPESDVAVIKIEGNNYPYLELGDSDALEVGEWVVAIGNPFGLSHTVTAGIVSAKSRKIGLTSFDDFIQTDAAINPGNSGGPLLNLDGKAVGINTAIIGSSGNIGIGLAIPINLAKNAYEQIKHGGEVVRGFIGVTLQDLTEELVKTLNVDKDVKGAVIADVTEGSPADKAGLKQYDIIVAVDGKPVEKSDTFRNKIAMLKPGTKVKLDVLRDNKKKYITVELGKRPSEEALASAEQGGSVEKLGLSVQNLTSEIADRLGYKNTTGVVVTAVESGSLADFAGISVGTLIIEVNRKPVKNVSEFNRAIKEAEKGKTVMLLVQDRNYKRLITLNIP